MESDTQRFNLRRIVLNDVGLWLTASLRIRKHLFHTFARVLYLEDVVKKPRFILIYRTLFTLIAC